MGEEIFEPGTRRDNKRTDIIGEQRQGPGDSRIIWEEQELYQVPGTPHGLGRRKKDRGEIYEI